MLKFHPNFKSADPEITKSLNIDIKLGSLGLIISNQHLFSRHTTPYEIKQWDKRELNSFKIEYSQIDRLYIFLCNNWWDNEIHYDLIIRIKYKDESNIYAYLTTECIIIDENHFIYGSIFISRDVKIFMRLVLNQFWNIDNVYKFLEYDGIYLKVHNEIKKDALNLKTICYESVYNNRQRLQFQIMDIPKILYENIIDMIKFREARDAYKKERNKICDYYKIP